MIELPESIVLSRQITSTLKGKVITDVIANYSPHKFAFFHHDAEGYSDLLAHGVPAIHYYTKGKADNIREILKRSF